MISAAKDIVILIKHEIKHLMDELSSVKVSKKQKLIKVGGKIVNI